MQEQTLRGQEIPVESTWLGHSSKEIPIDSTRLGHFNGLYEVGKYKLTWMSPLLKLFHPSENTRQDASCLFTLLVFCFSLSLYGRKLTETTLSLCRINFCHRVQFIWYKLCYVPYNLFHILFYSILFYSTVNANTETQTKKIGTDDEIYEISEPAMLVSPTCLFYRGSAQ